MKCPVGAEGDLDGLFAVGGPGGVTWPFPGDMDDAEPDLGSDLPESGSNTVTFGEPDRSPTNPNRGLWLTPS